MRLPKTHSTACSIFAVEGSISKSNKNIGEYIF